MIPTWHRWLHYLIPLQHIFLPAIGMGIVAVRIIRQRFRENRATQWPTAEAVFQAVRVVPGSGYWVQIDYRYYAQSEYRYGKFQRHFRRKVTAEAFAAAMRNLQAPTQVPIRYSPKDPNLSVLIERDLHFSGQTTGALQPR